MKKKVSLTIGAVLLIIALGFVGFSINHPEATFPWGNRVTFMIYGAYIWLLFKFLISIPFLKPLKGSLPMAIIYLFMAIVFFVMEITGEKVDIYTIIRGFGVLGSINVVLESLFFWLKGKRGQV